MTTVGTTAPPPPAPATPGPLATVRKGLADNVRQAGAGVDAAYEYTAVANDYAMIAPVEAFSAASTAVRKATEGIPVVSIAGNLASKVIGAGSFVTAFGNLMLSGMLRAPGDLAASTANAIADRIDGGQQAATGAAAVQPHLAVKPRYLPV